ncbi:siroheme decarboxylase subunit beta [Thiohalomonas denitrificans]|uniref:siroheme decarboxylase subunit beta n=1 Tax=Thiohalomonas denitrificans TaxID=415747 RepID=UPI001FDF07FB|nr:AsnC family transcriptional regulator [Thiohalomonas denitrificans]
MSEIESASLDPLERHLLNDFQRNLPLEPRPFQRMAEQLGTSEARVLECLSLLNRDGRISRVGPVFRPHSVGTSTLAAMAVPGERLDEVALLINQYPEVNHNYEREHRINLWFVVTAPDEPHLQEILKDMELRTGLPVISLPMLEAYHIDLGFSLQWGVGNSAAEASHPSARQAPFHPGPGPGLGKAEGAIESEFDRRLVATIQQGLPLVAQPFAEIAEQVGLDERQVIRRLREWLANRVISRLGVIVRHRRLGYRANAMVVWDVPDDRVSQLGRCMGQYDFVTLCYQRPRRLPEWRYNLFCMIHGRDRDTVIEKVEWLVQQCDLQDIPHRLLFSRRSFKQRGAHYQRSDAADHGTVASRQRELASC